MPMKLDYDVICYVCLIWQVPETKIINYYYPMVMERKKNRNLHLWLRSVWWCCRGLPTPVPTHRLYPNESNRKAFHRRETNAREMHVPNSK